MKIKIAKNIFGCFSLLIIAVSALGVCDVQAQSSQDSFMQNMLAKMRSAKKVSAQEKESVVKFMQDFKKAFEDISKEKLMDFDSIERAIDRFANIDASKCPSEVREKYDAFLKDLKEQISEVKKIINGDDSGGNNSIGEGMDGLLKTKQNIAEKISDISKSLQKSSQEFTSSLLPYLVP